MPEGLLVTGDAACAFNPVYGQGMSSAALGATVLANCLKGRGPGDIKGLGRRFQAELADSNARPWLLATGEDYRYGEAQGPPPGLMTRLAHWYLDRVFDIATRVPYVRQRLMEVIHLVRPPSGLFSIGVLGRTLLPWA